MPKRKGRRLTPYSQTGPVGRAVKATGTEWKEVEKLAVEVALHPEAFVGGDEALANRLVLSTKHLFDLGRQWENVTLRQHGGQLKELALDGFDSEQVWEQLALHHTPLLRHLRRQSYNLATAADKRPHSFFPYVKREEEEKMEEEEEDEGESGEMEEDDEEEEAMADGGQEDEELDDDEDESLENGSVDADVTGDAEEDGEEDSEQEDEDEEDGDDNDDDAEEESSKSKKREEAQKPRRTKKQGDRFFNFDDMERFIEEGELAAEKERDEEDGVARSDDEGDIADDLEDIEAEDEEGELDMELMGDFSEEDEDDEGGDEDDGGEEEALGGGIKYDQFFDAPEGMPMGGSGGKNKSKSKGKKGLEDKIAELEDQIVGSKPWQLRGEVDSRKRPLNSLLEEHVEFDTVVKQAPVITEEVTMALEDVIKRRIIEGSFDDVVRREEEELDTHRPKPELDFAKSQKSLAELYEEEYLKSVDKAKAADKPHLAAVLEQKRTKDQEEVLRRFSHLAYKLDALSNFHFTPKPIVPELAVKENVAAIRMEEIIPIGVSDSSLLAPHEVFAVDKKANALPTNDSASQKKLNRKKRKHTGSKVKDGMPKGKNVKRAEKTVGGPMTSTKLFKQLTQETQAAKGGKLPTKARAQTAAPTSGGRKDTGFKL